MVFSHTLVLLLNKVKKQGSARTILKPDNREGGSLFRYKRHPCYIVRTAAMVRGSNKCVWLMRNWKENCGKRCVGSFCRQHNYQIKKGMEIPAPCRSCGVGVLCDYRLCISCGGTELKHRLICKHKKAEKNFELVLLELMSTQLKN